MKLLVTGGAGFIGSCFVHQVVASGQDEVVVLDALTYAGNMANLDEVVDSPRVKFVCGSIADRAVVDEAIRGCDAVVNFAAESHVDRSIDDPGVFIETNVGGPRVLMDAAVDRRIRFVQISTDEVYGSLEKIGKFHEDRPLCPSSPYAATKAAADLLVGAYGRTYGLDGIITRCGNNYGPRQFPEKLIPLMIVNAIDGKELPLYGDGLNVRDWIHVEDHCGAIRRVLEAGKPGRVYNIGASSERTNKEICHCILAMLDRPRTLVRYVADRPGHDRRYALETSRIREELGWKATIPFDEGLRATVAWYRDHRDWWEAVRNGSYRAFYEKLYRDRMRHATTTPQSSGESD